MGDMLLDSHHHFDFLSADVRAAFLRALSVEGVRVVAQTLTPAAFVELVDAAGALDVDEASLPLWSLGLHPWYLGDEVAADAALAEFASAVHRTRFVGEIGLDFSPRRLEDAPALLQVRVLRAVLQQVRDAAARASAERPYVLSIHAVRAAGEVLDLLEELEVDPQHVVPVFHWYSGTSQDLTRLVRLGGHISVHPSMLAGKRGRAYVKQVPADRLLLESDLPEAPDTAASADELVGTLRQTLASLSDLRGCDMATEVCRTQERLYGVG